MSTIERLFQTLRAQGRKALMPFITAGDPDLEFSAALLAELVAPRLPPVRSGHSLQRPDRRRAGDPGFVHPGAGPAASSWPRSLQMLGRRDARACRLRW